MYILTYFFKNFPTFLLKDPISTVQLVFWFVYKLVIWQKKDRTFYRRWNKIVYPANILWWLAIQEIFINQYYKELSWFENILDLGWYFWETALFLSRINWHIDVYEADPKTYKYMHNNICAIKNISAYNMAVVASNQKEMYFDDIGWYNMWWHITTDATKNLVQCIHIKDILNAKQYQWIKIDIEWSEYGVVEWISTNYWRNKFKQWYVEFHYWNDEWIAKIDIMIRCISDLQTDFDVHIYDAQDGREIFDDMKNIKEHIQQRKLNVVFVSFAAHA